MLASFLVVRTIMEEETAKKMVLLCIQSADLIIPLLVVVSVAQIHLIVQSWDLMVKWISPVRRISV